jgi:hypothetical protein
MLTNAGLVVDLIGAFPPSHPLPPLQNLTHSSFRQRLPAWHASRDRVQGPRTPHPG